MNYESPRQKSDSMIRNLSLIFHLFFGALILGVGAIIFKKDHFNIASINKFTADRDPLLMQLFGGICMLYGAWRLYRAYTSYKQNY
jgi:hypothetical protein